MARFTAPEKWNDEWFSNLQPIEKLVFLYLIDRCDNAGFFEINKRIDSFLIGISQEEFTAHLTTLNKSYISSTDGRKIWLKNYLRYQKNLPLNPDNNAHKQIINFIQTNFKIFNYDFNYLGANQGLFSPIGKGNILGKGQVTDGGMGEDEIPPNGNDSKIQDPVFWESEKKSFLNGGPWISNFCRDKKIGLEKFDELAKEFVADLDHREDFKPLKEIRSHFTHWFNKYHKANGAKQQHKQSGSQNGTTRFNAGAHELLDKLKSKPHS